MSDYERFALLVDSQTGALGSVAIRLLELGIDVLYANHVDEAALLARQESRRLGAVLLPTSFGSDDVARLLARVCSELAAGARSLVLVGLEPDPDLVEDLRAKGVKWCLWEPYDERELRFVMTAAMASDHADDRRKELRIPTALPTAVAMGRHRKEVTVHDLSVGGAYLATPHPFLEGSRINVDIALPGGSVMGKAEVANAKTAGKPGRPDVPNGMGIFFTELFPGSEETLRSFIRDWMRRFEL
jgi:hypothetical protein